MSRQIDVDGLQLRLVPSTVRSQYWVHIRPSDRSIGVVYKIRSRWMWASTKPAFRGDGRPGLETDGLEDKVPEHLLGAGSESTLQRACEELILHLLQTQAPALGYGPHPDVERSRVCVSPVPSSLF
jgi:hypothetical protein